MTVRHPGGYPNAHLFSQLKRDVLERVPQITSIEYVPNEVVAKQLKAIFDPDRLDPPTGPDSPELVIEWYRQTPHDWFRVNYADLNTDFFAGWHQDEEHPNLGRAHFQYSSSTDADRWGVSFTHQIPSLILWEIIEALFGTILPKYLEG